MALLPMALLSATRVGERRQAAPSPQQLLCHAENLPSRLLPAQANRLYGTLNAGRVCAPKTLCPHQHQLGGGFSRECSDNLLATA